MSEHYCYQCRVNEDHSSKGYAEYHEWAAKQQPFWLIMLQLIGILIILIIYLRSI